MQFQQPTVGTIDAAEALLQKVAAAGPQTFIVPVTTAIRALGFLINQPSLTSAAITLDIFGLKSNFRYFNGTFQYSGSINSAGLIDFCNILPEIDDQVQISVSCNGGDLWNLEVVGLATAPVVEIQNPNGSSTPVRQTNRRPRFCFQSGIAANSANVLAIPAPTGATRIAIYNITMSYDPASANSQAVLVGTSSGAQNLGVYRGVPGAMMPVAIAGGLPASFGFPIWLRVASGLTMGGADVAIFYDIEDGFGNPV